MYKITIKGTAKTDYPKLSNLDGISCYDEFSENFNKASSYGPGQQSLIDKGVKNGYLSFKYEKDIFNTLFSVVTYEADQLLNNEEIQLLLDYTEGQLSDGIGEGFEQFPCYNDPEYYNDDYEDDEQDGDVYVSPWHREQVLTFEQTEL